MGYTSSVDCKWHFAKAEQTNSCTSGACPTFKKNDFFFGMEQGLGIDCILLDFSLIPRL